MMTYGLGRIHIPDERDAAFPMALHLDTVGAVNQTSMMWEAGPAVLDQGESGECVGFAGANWEQNRPGIGTVSNQTGHDNYAACKALDGDPREGSNDRFLMKALVAQGRIERYLWATSPDEMRNWVLTTGPVLCGTDWYEEMFSPDGNHQIHIGGAVAGGHEYLIRGYQDGFYRLRNSWGADWGDNGEVWIAEGDLYQLVFMVGNGDACAAVEKVYGAVAPEVSAG